MRNQIRLGAAPEQLEQAERKSSGQHQDADIWFWCRDGRSADRLAGKPGFSGIDKKSEFPAGKEGLAGESRHCCRGHTRLNRRKDADTAGESDVRHMAVVGRIAGREERDLGHIAAFE